MSDEAELEALLRQLIVDWENEVVEFKARLEKIIRLAQLGNIFLLYPTKLILEAMFGLAGVRCRQQDAHNGWDEVRQRAGTFVATEDADYS